MITKSKLEDKFESLTNALTRLKEALERKFDDEMIKRDVCIKRFEFTIEVYWKFLKRFLEFKGETDTVFARNIMQTAYSKNLLDNEKLWLDMLKDRNMTSHIYDEDEINKIYKRIKKYYPEMQKTYDLLKEKFKEELKK